MDFHFYITCIYHDNIKLEIHHVPAVDDLHTSTGMHTTILSSGTEDEWR